MTEIGIRLSSVKVSIRHKLHINCIYLRNSKTLASNYDHACHSPLHKCSL